MADCVEASMAGILSLPLLVDIFREGKPKPPRLEELLGPLRCEVPEVSALTLEVEIAGEKSARGLIAASLGSFNDAEEYGEPAPLTEHDIAEFASDLGGDDMEQKPLAADDPACRAAAASSAAPKVEQP